MLILSNDYFITNKLLMKNNLISLAALAAYANATELISQLLN